MLTDDDVERELRLALLHRTRPPRHRKTAVLLRPKGCRCLPRVQNINNDEFNAETRVSRSGITDIGHGISGFFRFRIDGSVEAKSNGIQLSSGLNHLEKGCTAHP